MMVMSMLIIMLIIMTKIAITKKTMTMLKFHNITV